MKLPTLKKRTWYIPTSTAMKAMQSIPKRKALTSVMASDFSAGVLFSVKNMSRLIRVITSTKMPKKRPLMEEKKFRAADRLLHSFNAVLVTETVKNNDGIN